MNGRVYDPVLGRFLSADTFVPYPDSLQSYNRYSYVQNNPLSRIDPSGFADVELIAPADPAHYGGTVIPAGQPGVTTVNVHGGAGGNGFFSTDPATGGASATVTTTDINNAITANGHTAGEEIRAYICYGAVGQNLQELQTVAATQNSPVIAATGPVAPVVSRNRGVDTYLRSEITNGGRWMRIDPNGTVREYGTPQNAAKASKQATKAQAAETRATAAANQAQSGAAQAATTATQATASATQTRANADAAKGTTNEKAEAKKAVASEKAAQKAQKQASKAQQNADDAAAKAAEAAQWAQEAAARARELANEAARRL